MMEKTGWKVLAIIGWSILLAIFVFGYWAYVSGIEEQEKSNDCLYNICSENDDASYNVGVCTCYDLDMLGDYVVAKTKYIK